MVYLKAHDSQYTIDDFVCFSDGGSENKYGIIIEVKFFKAPPSSELRHVVVYGIQVVNQDDYVHCIVAEERIVKKMVAE